MAKLTVRMIDAAPIPSAGQAFIWDQELRGFGVRLLPSGVKTFVLQYRNSEGRGRRMTIARVGTLSLDQAREQARIKLGEVALGKDPAQDKIDARHAVTVAEVCDWYLAEAKEGRLLGRRRRPIKASTLHMDSCRIKAHIKPLLGNRQVRGLTLSDVEKAQADIAAGKTAKIRLSGRGGVTTGGQGVAARTISTLHGVFEHAVRLGFIETNPAKGVRRLASTPRDRRLSRSEIEKLGKAMQQAEADGEHPIGLAAIRLLLLTGFRRMEGLPLEWSWLNEEERSIRFSDTKGGPQTRVIGQDVVDLLLAQPKIAKSPYFFPADRGEGHFVGIVRVLDRVCAIAELDDVTPHTLRHTFASVAGDLGFTEITIAALLGHAARGVTQRYVHVNDSLRFAADSVSAEIASLLDDRPRQVRRFHNGCAYSQPEQVA